MDVVQSISPITLIIGAILGFFLLRALIKILMLALKFGLIALVLLVGFKAYQEGPEFDRLLSQLSQNSNWLLNKKAAIESEIGKYDFHFRIAKRSEDSKNVYRP